MMAEKKYAINPKEVEPEYQELAARLDYSGSLYLPRIYKKAFTLEQARVLIEFDMPNEEIASILGVSADDVASDTQKYQIEAIAKKLNLDKGTLEKHVQYAFELGFAFPTRRGWRTARAFGQLRDSQSNPKFDEQLGDEYFDLWQAFERLEVYPAQVAPRIMTGTAGAGSYLRIIPSRKSLQNIADIVPDDNLAELLKNASTIAVVPCPCKRLVRDRDPGIPVEVCIVTDNAAEHNIRKGCARVLSIEEALEVQEMANEAGLVSFPQGPRQVCHCHWSCCGVISPPIMVGRPPQLTIAPSYYQPVVDPEKCTGCQACVTRCQFDAIDMIRYPGAAKQQRLKAWVNPDKCLGCGLCVTKCPSEARVMKQVRDYAPATEEPARPADVTGAIGRRGKSLDTGSLLTRPMQ